MKTEHRENLAKLADWLDENMIPLGAGGDVNDDGWWMGNGGRFTMGFYRTDIEHKCGSAGCAIGWATEAVEPRQISDYWIGKPAPTAKEDLLESWTTYATRLFGVSDADVGAGQFMFSYRWAGWDDMNTPAQAAARIRAVIELDGEAPESWAHWVDGYFAGDDLV